MEAIMETSNETKESLSFSKLDAWRRIRKLRDQYGGEAGLSKASGISILQLRKYCSESYMQKHNFRQKTWEKYFGPWEDKEPTFVMLAKTEDEKEAAQKAMENTTNKDADTEKIETPAEPEIKMPRLILEVPSLEDLDATLELYGMKIVIE